MNILDKAKNKTQEMSGKAKQRIGRATDDRSLEAKGQRERVSGALKNAAHKVKDAFT
jgi:uncharacterized protein YjbJ (UPF0337 family)